MINYTKINEKLAETIVSQLSYDEMKMTLKHLLQRENCRKVDGKAIPEEVKEAVMCFFEDVIQEKAFYVECGLSEKEIEEVMA